MVLVVGLVEALVDVDWSACDQGAVTSVLGDVRRVRGWLASIEIAAARRLSELDAVLISGDTSAGHLDVVTRALRQLTPIQRDRLAERGEVLALAAGHLPRDEFARTVRAEVRRIHDNDGIDRLQRQRRNTSLRTWTDRDTGMWCLRGEFDPETALLAGQLRNTVEAMFHNSQPDTCPTDPLAKLHHLQALALNQMTQGRGAQSSGRIDMSVVIDINTLIDGEHPNTILDCGIPIDFPAETLRRWACQADITPTIIAADGVSLYLGRTQRIANRAQRRALRAMYRSCAIPGCTVAYDHCQIHHLHWYRKGGNTNIDNLAPICNKHHHLVHEGGWHLTIDPHRNLTITYPDGTTTTTGPPTTRAP